MAILEGIPRLLEMAVAERPDALGEIVDQADNFLQYFMGVLGDRQPARTPPPTA